jgi:hypothetical protein
MTSDPRSRNHRSWRAQNQPELPELTKPETAVGERTAGLTPQPVLGGRTDDGRSGD